LVAEKCALEENGRSNVALGSPSSLFHVLEENGPQMRNVLLVYSMFCCLLQVLERSYACRSTCNGHRISRKLPETASDFFCASGL